MINWRGLYTLFSKEVWRFIKVMMQTVLTPIITVLLYLLVFSSVLSEHVQVYHGISYTAFLVPGLIMMSVLQNAFANSSSSLFQSKQNGNLVFVLLAPLSHLEFYLAFVGAAIVRGLMVGVGVWLAAHFFVDLPLRQPGLVLWFGILGSGILGAFGLMAAVVADKWDHISAFQNFVILPLSFLSGVFYSIYSLPGIWSELSLYNPFFYMIDGFRHGFLGVSDAPPWLSAGVVLAFFVAVTGGCLWLLHSGYKMRE